MITAKLIYINRSSTSFFQQIRLCIIPVIPLAINHAKAKSISPVSNDMFIMNSLYEISSANPLYAGQPLTAFCR